MFRGVGLALLSLLFITGCNQAKFKSREGTLSKSVFGSQEPGGDSAGGNLNQDGNNSSSGLLGLFPGLSDIEGALNQGPEGDGIKNGGTVSGEETQRDGTNNEVDISYLCSD